MSQPDDFGTAYLRLTLEIDRHVEGYVDAYYGPPDLKAEVEAGEPTSPRRLLDDLARLRELSPAGDASRRAFLAGELRAMETTLRSLNGETFHYLDEIERLHGFRPVLVEEAALVAARNELDSVLPGKGEVGARLRAWRRGLEVPADRVPALLELAHDETRRRTLAFIDLPEGEQVAMGTTSGTPWIGFNGYEGQYRSTVTINTDFPFALVDVADVVAHEAYPGHHTEQVLKEQHLYLAQGVVEQASTILYSPASVQAEGIAMTAIDIIFPDGSQYEWLAEVLSPVAGLQNISAEQMRRVGEACKQGLFYSYGVSLYALERAAYSYFTGDISAAQAVDYLGTHGLATPEVAARFLDNVSNPAHRTYTFTYAAGYNLIAKAARGGDRQAIFERLLVENVLPSEMAQM